MIAANIGYTIAFRSIETLHCFVTSYKFGKNRNRWLSFFAHADADNTAFSLSIKNVERNLWPHIRQHVFYEEEPFL